MAPRAVDTVTVGEAESRSTAKSPVFKRRQGVSFHASPTLTPNSVANSKARGEAGRFRLVEIREWPTDVRLISVYRFKGLEAPAIIVCEIDEGVETPEMRRLLYVACSRARVLLTLVISSR